MSTHDEAPARGAAAGGGEWPFPPAAVLGVRGEHRRRPVAELLALLGRKNDKGRRSWTSPLRCYYVRFCRRGRAVRVW